MGALSRTKGHSAERELAALLRDELGCDVRRNLVQARDGGADLVGDGVLTPYSIEVKRARSAPPALLRGWWAQTLEQAEAVQRIPVLAYRCDRAEWRLRLPLAVAVPTLSGSALADTLEVGLPAFCALVRELAP